MPKTKVLITVTTYPLPSRSYDELVCTAGILEDGSWIRIYPVPLSFLIDLKNNGQVKNVKYTWIELELKKRTDDFRPESFSPKFYNFNDLVLYNRLDTKDNWSKRKEICLKNTYFDLSELIDLSKTPHNISLATYKPRKVISFEWEEDEREWKNEWKELRKQTDLFSSEKPPEQLIPKLPFKFFYKFEDESGKIRRLMIEDWELGALYWNCLKKAKGNEHIALKNVYKKFGGDFLKNKDLYFFLGTTKEWHTRRSKNPFVIIGVFYPKRETQYKLFDEAID